MKWYEADSWQLDEKDGQFYYHGERIGPVPKLGRYGFAYASTEFRHTLGAVIHTRDEHQAMPEGYWPCCPAKCIFRCRGCGLWVIGQSTCYCSLDCYRKVHAQWMRKRRAAARKPVEQATCATCGKPTVHQRSTKRFCSPACRQRACRAKELSAAAVTTQC